MTQFIENGFECLCRRNDYRKIDVLWDPRVVKASCETPAPNLSAEESDV